MLFIHDCVGRSIAPTPSSGLRLQTADDTVLWVRSQTLIKRGSVGGGIHGTVAPRQQHLLETDIMLNYLKKFLILKSFYCAARAFTVWFGNSSSWESGPSSPAEGGAVGRAHHGEFTALPAGLIFTRRCYSLSSLN